MSKELSFRLPDELTFERRLGQSPLSEVVLVHDAEGQRFALKVLRASVSGDQRIRERWRREAALLEELEHPNLVRSHGALEIDGRPALLLEYIDGSTLRDALADGPLGWEQAARYGVQVARALDRLHRHGAVHRDVKPHNVLLDSKRGAVLADLGLVRREEDPTLTRQGAALGSPAYMSPEQARDPSDVDEQADLYSLGATLHHALSGAPPFLGNGVGEVIHRVLHEEPEPLPDTVPESLARVLETAMAKDPERRYGRARDFASDLGRVLLGYPPRLLTRYRRRAKQRIAVTAVAAALLLVVVGLWQPWSGEATDPTLDREVVVPEGEAFDNSSGNGAPEPGVGENAAGNRLPDAAAWFASWSVGYQERFDAALRRDRYREALSELDAVRRIGVPATAPTGFLELRRAWYRDREDAVHAQAETRAAAAMRILENEVVIAQEAADRGRLDGTLWAEEVRSLWRDAGLNLDDLPLRPGGPDPHARLIMNRAVLVRRAERVRVQLAVDDVPAVRADTGRLLRGGHFESARLRWLDVDAVVFEHSEEARSDLARIDELLALERRLEARFRESARTDVDLLLANGGRLAGELLPRQGGGHVVNYLGQEKVPIRLLMLDVDFVLEWLQMGDQPWLAAQLRWCQAEVGDAVMRMEALRAETVPPEWNLPMWIAEWREEFRTAPVEETGDAENGEAGAETQLVESKLLESLRSAHPTLTWSLVDGEVVGELQDLDLGSSWDLDLRRSLRGWRLASWELGWDLALGATVPDRVQWLNDVRLDRRGRRDLPEVRLGGKQYPGFGILAGQGTQSLRWDGESVELDGVRIGSWAPTHARLQLQASASGALRLTTMRVSFRATR